MKSRGFTGRHHSEQTKKRLSKIGKGRPAWNKGKCHSEKTKRKMSIARKGKKFTYEHKKAMSKSKEKHWQNPEYREKMSLASKGRIVSKEQREKISKSLTKKGLPHCLDCGKRLSDYRAKKCWSCFGKSIIGQNNPYWKGKKGLTAKHARIRVSPEYINWRLKVFERDGFCCQSCRVVGGNLHAHHILAFAKYPELRFEVNNGVTLCKQCHELLHGRKICSRNSA